MSLVEYKECISVYYREYNVTITVIKDQYFESLLERYSRGLEVYIKVYVSNRAYSLNMEDFVGNTTEIKPVFTDHYMIDNKLYKAYILVDNIIECNKLKSDYLKVFIEGNTKILPVFELINVLEDQYPEVLL